MIMHTSSRLDASPLGRATAIARTYAPDILVAVERRAQEAAGVKSLGAADSGQGGYMTGYDEWTLWELSWLDERGVPEMGYATFRLDCRSPYLPESKSLKLYLMSLHHTSFPTRKSLQALITRDLDARLGAAVTWRWMSEQEACVAPLRGLNLDAQCKQDLTRFSPHTLPMPSCKVGSVSEVDETVYTQLFRSLCPVTGQPDFATVAIRYAGRALCLPSLLSYLLNFREHQALHEACVEKIYRDIMRECTPTRLCVQARFLRRGGIDINPLRTNAWQEPLQARLFRQ